MDKIKEDINNSIDSESQKQLSEINVHLVLKAIKLMKQGKRDLIFDTVSDMFIDGPMELAKHLTFMIRSFLVHGKIPLSLLLCILTPIVKNNLEDLTSSSNYRAIAGGCLILKLIDQIFLLVENSKLKFDELQFAYQHNSSTNMCTWMVNSVIEHFNIRCS